MQKEPRINKTKEQIQAEMKHKEKVAHMKDVVRRIFPLLSVPTIYDAQTTLNAITGFIKADLEEKMDKVKVIDTTIDLSKEKESEIKTAMLAIIEEFKDEPADEFAQTIDRLSRAFSEFGSSKFVKNPISDIKLEDILAS